MAKRRATLPTFEKLRNDSNYDIWQFQMEVYLTHYGLWKYTKDTPDDDEFEIQQDQMARALIGLTIEKECILYIERTKNTREAWEALKTAYRYADKSRLLAKLVSLKLDQFKTMRQYVTEVLLTAQKLKNIGKEVDDELLAIILLQGLNEKYAGFRIAIENSDKELTVNYVKHKLLGLEDENKILDSDDSSRSKKKTKQQKKERKDKQIKCRVCQGNHEYRECPDLSLAVPPVEKKREGKPKGRPSSSSSEQKSSMDWVMDSGDYANMSDRKDYPCFIVTARLALCCLVKFFKLW